MKTAYLFPLLAAMASNLPAAGGAEGGQAAAGLDQQAVDMPVVTAHELDDHVATGEAACQPDGAHGGLCAGVDHAYLRHAGDHFDDLLSQINFTLCWCAKTQCLLGLVDHCRHRGLMVVAENPAAFEPRSASNASEKSPVDKPFKYSTGTASSRRGERRM